MEVQPETDTLTHEFVLPQIPRSAFHDKRPHWDTTLDYFEPWPIKRILILSPEAKDSGISSRENENKEKEKMKRKEKKDS